MRKSTLAIILMLGVCAERLSAITTTLEYEDQREAASRAAISNEITAAIAALPPSEPPGDYAAISNAAMNARDKTDLALYKKVGVGDTWTLVDDATSRTATGVFRGLDGEGYWEFFIDGAIVGGSAGPDSSDDYNVAWASYDSGGTATRPFAYQPVTGDALAKTSDIAAATNGIPRITESEEFPGTAAFADIAGKAVLADISKEAGDLASLSEVRSGDEIFAQLDAATATNAAQSQSISTLGSQVSAIGAHLNAEDARFVSTNYNSETHMPEAYVEVKITENGESSWLTVWREMTRWDWFLGIYTNQYAELSAALANKGEREYAFYDGVTGEPAPDGFFWIAQPRVAVAAGMSYQRYVDTGGAVWVLESNGMVADVNGTTNGFFRISDDEGNAQFEIVKGSSRTVVAAPGAMTHESVMGVMHWFTTYAVTNAASAPVAMFSRQLYPTTSDQHSVWWSETDADCPCNVSWTSPDPGTYVCEWWPKATEPRMFMKAKYGQGTESRIVQSAPVEMQYIVINGVKYTLGTATISGNTVLTLSPAAP